MSMDAILCAPDNFSDMCRSTRLSYARPEHIHSCLAPVDHRLDDGHVCPCGDWWHD